MMYASANLCKQNKWHTHSIVSARFEAKNAGQINSQKTNIFMKKKQLWKEIAGMLWVTMSKC